MDLGLLKTRILNRGTFGDLRNPEAREAALGELAEQSARNHQANSSKSDVWRRPIIEASEILAAAGADEADAFRVAADKMPDEAFWRLELFKRILPRPSLDERDLVHLERETQKNPRNLSLWQRLLEESQKLGDEERVARVRQEFARALSAFFPARGECTWYDVETESRARSLFFNTLDDVVDGLLSAGRSDDVARELVSIAYEHFPNRPELKTAKARFCRESGERTTEALGTALEALLVSPDDEELKLFAAELLLEREGHEGEGASLLVQLWEENPHHDRATELLARHYISKRSDDDQAIEVTQSWFASHPEDSGAADLIANFYANRNERSIDAIEAYEAAIRLMPEDRRYLRLLANMRLAEENWEEVARLFDRLQSLGDNGVETIMPLANAYARLGKMDRDAFEVYRKAFGVGAKTPSIVNQYCKALYQHDPDEIDALETFHKVYRTDQRCFWAALGVARKEMHQGDLPAALGKLTALLHGDHQPADVLDMAADIVAADPKRSVLRQLMTIPPKTALKIFERAAQRQPDALNILTSLAKYRLAQGMRDADTEKLLATICKRDPEDVEMRLARADLLHESGRLNVAVDLYKELIARSRATTPSGSRPGIRTIFDERPRMLSRVSEFLLRSPLARQEDASFLIEAALDPGASDDLVHRIAKKFLASNMTHPLDLPLIEKALAVEPDNEELELAEARARARRGNAREMVHLAVKRIEAMRYEPECVALLAEAIEAAKPQHVTDDVESRIVQIFETRRLIPDSITTCLARLLLAGGRLRNEHRIVYRRAAQLPNAGKEFLDALERCRGRGGE